jgi:nucleoside phosphorylase
VSVDLFYEAGPPGGGHEGLAVEMEAATLFALGAREGIAVGCLLVVSDTFPHGARNRIDDDSLAAAAERMGAVALAALSA